MKLDIIHTNDIHSHIDQFAKIGAYVKQTRADNEGTLLIDCGDMITGNFQFKFNLGAAERELNNFLKYDVVTLGNHDFDLGLEYLQDHMNQIDASYVVSNVIDIYGKLGEYTQTVIKEVNGIKVGFISFLLPYIKTYIEILLEEVDTFDFTPVEAYQQVIDQIRDEVDILIAINHQGIERDIMLAEDTTGIDLIIGAHSHTTLQTPTVINDTPIYQTGCFSENLGHIQLEFENEMITNLEYKLIELETYPKVCLDAKAIVDKYNQIANDHDTEVFGSCSHTLEGRREVMIKQSTDLGSLICDSYIDYAKEQGYNPDFAFINARGLRQSIEAGDITLRKLYNVMPFEKQLFVFDILGRNLKAALSNKIELQTSNLKIINENDTRQFYDRSLNQPIEDERYYQIATMNYLYEHHLFGELRDSKLLASNIGSDLQVVSSYIKKLGFEFSYKSNQMVETYEQK